MALRINMYKHYIIIIFIMFLVGCKKSDSPVNKNEDEITGMEKYEYTCSDGGPFLVIPKCLSQYWKGHMINMLNPLDPKTDYGRACSIDGNWGLINVGKGSALVFADPPMVSWASSEDNEYIDVFVLQMWNITDLDSLIDNAITEISDDAFEKTDAFLEVDKDGLLIVFAGDKIGDPVYGELAVPTVSGKFVIYTAHYKDKDGEVEIYRLHRHDAQAAGSAK